MTPREIQRTIDFIIRSQADAVIRMDRWNEEWEQRLRVWDDKIQKQLEAAHAENREALRLVQQNTRDIHRNTRDTRELKKLVDQNARETRELKKIVREIAIANRRHERQLRSP